MDKFLIPAVSQEEYTNAVAERVAMNGASFSSVDSPGEFRFFNSIMLKVAPNLVHPNRKKVRRLIIAHWDHGFRPAVRFPSIVNPFKNLYYSIIHLLSFS